MIPPWSYGGTGPICRRLFDIRRPLGRIKLARWFSAVGVAEYNLKRSLLAAHRPL